VTEALAIDDLHFDYGQKPAVRGVSLRIAPGDCYGFLGHNGAGKTTVMRLCLGLLAPAAGHVRIFGVDAQQRRREANGLVGAVIERTGFHQHVRARQNLIALARLQGMPRRLAHAEAERVLDATGLAGAAHRRVATFSMGMRQRLGIAQALLGRPRLLLLDEPTNGLDPEGIAELRALLLRLTRDEGAAVLLSSHQLAELEGLCNRIGVLRDGAMVVEGDLDSLRTQVGMRHVVAGQPLAALRQRLEQLGLAPVADGERLLVDLQQRPAAEVARALATGADLTMFAPEQATLERIYLRAHRDGAPAKPTDGQPPRRPIIATPPAEPPAEPPAPQLGTTSRPLQRAFRFEATTLWRQRASLPLVLLPCAIAVFAVRAYAARVRAGLALVDGGERFSADDGSGYLAVAQALQTATPVLGLALIWLASQTIAADLAGDTLRNSLTRSVRRRDVLFGKLGVLFAFGFTGWLLLVVTAMVAAAATVGFGDLEEVSRYGDRDVLAAAADVAPTMYLAIAQMTLPLAAVVVLATAASAAARRPARALALALVVVLGPELLRDSFGEAAGWLLTSHVPNPLRDDSALGYLAAVARGAADALWPFADLAVLAPLCWLAAGGVAVVAIVARMRVA